MGGSVDGCMEGRMVEGWIGGSGWVGEWVDGRMDGRTGGWMHVHMDTWSYILVVSVCCVHSKPFFLPDGTNQSTQCPS